MNFRNYTQESFRPAKNYKKKTFIINKLQKHSLIPGLQQKKDLLFENPESYLKLPYENNFHFVVGKKPKGPRFNSDNQLIPYSVVGSLFDKPQTRKFTTKKSLVASNLSSKSIRKSLRSSKIKITPVNVINEERLIEDKKRKKTFIENLSPLQIFDIFNKSKKRITKNKSEIKDKKYIYKEFPKIMHQYINDHLSQQERALKNNEKYNDILKRIEIKISKSLKNKLKTKLKNKKYYNESKCFDSNIYNSSNLIQNSGIEYRKKIEKSNINDKRNNLHLILNNHIQNWEMSLRRPRNFIGERREYLNVRTDNNPYWVILTEKNPFEEEKIINPNYNIIKKCLNTYKSKPIRPLDLTTNALNSNEMNNLEIKGKKIIDVEEKIVNQMTGNIKMYDLKYDRESLKDLMFKTNYCINKHSFTKK